MPVAVEPSEAELRLEPSLAYAAFTDYATTARFGPDPDDNA